MALPTNNKPGTNVAGIKKPGAVAASLTRSNLVAGSLFSTRANNEAKILPISKIVPDSNQPRRTFDEKKLEELAQDIRERGILQPPIVRLINSDSDNEKGIASSGMDKPLYQLVVGERRYRAAKLAGLEEIPVIIREYSDEEARAVSLVENLQREDLTIEDEGTFFKRLSEEYNLSTRQIGKLISKNYLYVYKRIKLMERPDLLEQVQLGELNLNKALEMIREEGEQSSISASLNSVEVSSPEIYSTNQNNLAQDKNRFPGKQQAGNRNKTWKRFYQFTSYLEHTLPKIQLKDTTEEDKEELKNTLEQIEAQIGELKKKLTTS